MIGKARNRQLWMLFTDESNVQLRELIPLENYPISPADSEAEYLAASIKAVMENLGAARVIFVWERCQSERTTPAERAWAKSLAAACQEEGIAVRAQLISHRNGVSWFPSDDVA
jgi:hypothetical protein